VCEAACRALDVAGVALVVADLRGQVHFINEAAARLLGSAPLRVSRGTLRATTELDTRRLLAEIRNAASAPDEPRSVRVTGADGAISSVIAPLAVGQGADVRFAMLILTDGGPQEAEGQPEAIPLTGAETRLLAALTAGERLADYAERAGVKLSTVKTHLQSLFDKTGERRQSDLIRRALSDPQLRARLGEEG